MTKAEVLDAAKAAVADRGLNYGKPEDNFARIAVLWNAYVRNKSRDEDGLRRFSAADVAMMMALMKIARLQNDPSHLDSWIDIAGYAACGAEISA
jgi:macrodomain Ter protein organizer (MatP/YcbG family)